MTTIAWDGVTLAADTADTDSDSGIQIFAPKIEEYTLPSGESALITSCGSSEALNAFKAWLSGKRKNFPRKHCKDAWCVVITEDLIRQYNVSKHGIDYPPDQKLAWGSGSQGAMALMNVAGYNAEDAVKGMRQIDIYTGGEVDTLQL